MKTILAKKKGEKKLLKALKKKAGRNNSGRITVRHRGGGAKRFYRLVEFGQSRIGDAAKVLALEYDPNRTAFLALLEYENKEKKYILAPQGLKAGDKVIFSDDAPLQPGNRLRLEKILVGTMVYNIELQPGRGGKIARGAGTSAQVIAQDDKYTHLKMPSGERRKIFKECFASIGELSNQEHRFQKLNKAGTSRWKRKRPHVRGSAMNPIDHPHGGGEGKSGIGLKHPKTPWGKPALGVKTRKKKKWTDKLIIQRRKKKKRKK